MTTLLAVYGTLRRGGRLHHHLGTVAGRARFVGTGSITGALYEVPPDERDELRPDLTYPCLRTERSGTVVVELFELCDPTLLDELDEIEGYDPADLAGSEYHRQLVPVHGLDQALAAPASAWTYVYVRDSPDPTRHIAHGDWIAHHRDGQSRERTSGPRAAAQDASSNL